MIEVLYGFDTLDGDDRFVERLRRGVLAFSNIVVPGRYLVEMIPLLSRIPAWFPQARFKRDASHWARDFFAAKNEPYIAVAQSIVSLLRNASFLRLRSTHQPYNQAQGTAKACVLSTLIEQTLREHAAVSAGDEEHFKDVVGVAYIGEMCPSCIAICHHP